MRPAAQAALAGAIVAAVHVAFANRYGYFRDELYFIACAHHLALGYADQPPGAVLAALLAQPFGYALRALRIVPALCCGVSAAFAVLIAARLNGGTFARVFAALCTALAPISLLTGSVLSTTSFDMPTWGALTYCVLRLLQDDDARWWLAAGAVLGVSLWCKYTIALLAIALVLGLAVSRRRALLSNAHAPAGLLIALAIVAPNAFWQVAHGLPFFGVMRGDVAARHALQNGMQFEFRGWLHSALAFAAGTVILANPFAAPVWVCGIAALRRSWGGRFAPLAWTCAWLALLCLALSAKPYYALGVLPLLFAAGSVAIERLARLPVRRFACAGALVVLTLPAIPFCMPVLTLRTFVAYTQLLHLSSRSAGVVAQPLYADELGWRMAVQTVAASYRALPASVRARTAIFADSYAYAGALAFYGPALGLPQPISGQNSFYYWGPRGYDGSSVIAVGATDYALLRTRFAHVRMIAVVRNPQRAIIEGPLPIYLCTEPRHPLAQMWPAFQKFGA